MDYGDVRALLADGDTLRVFRAAVKLEHPDERAIAILCLHP